MAKREVSSEVPTFTIPHTSEENAERINAQKRSAYEKRAERENSAAEEVDV